MLSYVSDDFNYSLSPRSLPPRLVSDFPIAKKPNVSALLRTNRCESASAKGFDDFEVSYSVANKLEFLERFSVLRSLRLRRF